MQTQHARPACLQAAIDAQELEAWAAGLPPAEHTDPSATWRSMLSTASSALSGSTLATSGSALTASGSTYATAALGSSWHGGGSSAHGPVCAAAAAFSGGDVVARWRPNEAHSRDSDTAPTAPTAPSALSSHLRSFSSHPVTLQSHTRPLKLFSLNDYLGLASHPDVCAAAAAAAAVFGMGPRSSAVVGGTTAVHRELEEGIAALKGTPDCLLFPTGD